MSIEAQAGYHPSAGEQAAEADAMGAVVRALDAYLPCSVRAAPEHTACCGGARRA